MDFKSSILNIGSDKVNNVLICLYRNVEIGALRYEYINSFGGGYDVKILFYITAFFYDFAVACFSLSIALVSLPAT